MTHDTCTILRVRTWMLALLSTMARTCPGGVIFIPGLPHLSVEDGATSGALDYREMERLAKDSWDGADAR